MDENRKNEWNEKHYKSMLAYISVFMILTMGLYLYIHRSIGHIPLMDYWKNGAEVLQHILYDPIDLSSFVTFPHALHWNPLYDAYNYIFVRIFRSDNCSYIYAGMVITIMTTILLIIFYSKFLKNGKWDFIGALLFILPLYNLNQWEIIVLSCYVAFSLRIFLYVILWIWTDRLMSREGKPIELILYGLLSFGVIMYTSQAYYPGLVAGICGTVLLKMIIKKKIKKEDIIVVLVQISSALVCYLTMIKTPIGATESIALSKVFFDQIRGVLFMLAATIVPVTKQTDINMCIGIGSVIFLLTIIAIILFLKERMYEKTYLPLMLLVYAFVSILTIIAGRMYIYGFLTLGSSRYVVETTIGLMGLVSIYWYSFSHGKYGVKILSFITMMLLTIGIMYANKIEWGIGPYRAQYNINMQYLAEHIDEASDEELEMFQAPPEDVRETVKFMKENHLCIWK